MGTPQQLSAALRALLGAKKSFAMYPPGSEMATVWVRRLAAALKELFRQGETVAVRVGSDRFFGLGAELVTVDPALEAFRSDLEVRGIAEFSIDQGVEEPELQVFLELLTRPPRDSSLTGPPAYLRDRNVIHVSVGVPGGGGVSSRAGFVSGEGGSQSGSGAGLSTLHVGRDLLDLLVDAVLESVDERLADLAYDRTALLEWFKALAAGDGVDVLYTGVTMLAAMGQGRSDREVCTRTVLEALLLLPEDVLRPLLTERLVPLAASDLVAFNLLTHVTEDELVEIARLVPASQLMALTTELLELPWEQGKRQRVVQGITAMLRRREAPEPQDGQMPLLSRDDPLLLELRQEIVAACQPDVLLERSADILLALIFGFDQDDPPGVTVDALAELVAEALTRGQIPLAVRILRRLPADATDGEGPPRPHAHAADLLRRKLAGRTHVALVAGLLRQEAGAGEIELVTTYLQLVPAEAVDELLELLAEEGDRRVRLRLCQVLVRLGLPALPQILRRLGDPRWFVARNALYVVGKIGHAPTLPAIIGALEHSHPTVRTEAARSAGLVGGAAAVTPLLGRLADPDPGVRRTVIRWLGTLGGEGTIGPLRDLLVAPAATAAEWDLKQEAAHALVAIGSPPALAALEAIAGRRASFWQRADRRLSELVAAALTSRRPAPAADVDSGDGD